MTIAPAAPVRNTVVSSLSALLALAMPKCPLCAIALFAAFGIELHAATPVTVAFVVTPAAVIFLRRSSWLPVAIAVTGAACALLARFVFDRPLLFHAGVIAVVAAAALNYVALRRRCECDTTS
jgi:hypothetical protein